MARITKAELEELIKVKDNLIDTLIKKNVELESKLSKVNNKVDDEFCNSATYKQTQKEIEYLKDVVKAQEISIKTKEDTIKHERKRNGVLLNEIEHLKTQINVRCSLGRKQKFNDDEKATIQMLRLANHSYRAIAKQMNCSVGTIHKIIKEMEQE